MHLKENEFFTEPYLGKGKQYIASIIDYIEAKLIAKASSIGRLDCDNKNMGNKQKVSKFREVELEQYLEEALFLLELIHFY